MTTMTTKSREKHFERYCFSIFLKYMIGEFEFVTLLVSPLIPSSART